MTEQQTDPAADTLTLYRQMLVLERLGTAEEVVRMLLATADVALSQHHRSLSPAYGCGSGDVHGKHYCAGLCHVSIDHASVWEPWPCFPYLAILAALTGTSVVAITARELAEHKAACQLCWPTLRCPDGRVLAGRWRRALREAGQQT